MADTIGKRKYVLNPKWKQNFVDGLEFENRKDKPCVRLASGCYGGVIRSQNKHIPDF